MILPKIQIESNSYQNPRFLCRNGKFWHTENPNDAVKKKYSWKRTKSGDWLPNLKTGWNEQPIAKCYAISMLLYLKEYSFARWKSSRNLYPTKYI